MKFGNLSAVGKTPPAEQIMITLPAEMLDALKPYTEKQERSGFLREAGRLALGLTDQWDIEDVADNVLVSCESDADLEKFIKNLYKLGKELIDRQARVEKGDG